MQKPLLSQLLSPEKISKTTEAFIKLTPEQIGAIMRRKNQVDGRYVAADNLKGALLGMYRGLLAPMPTKQANAIPVPETKKFSSAAPAPEVAPPPVIRIETAANISPQTTANEARLPQKPAEMTNQGLPKNMPVSSGKAEQDAFVATARAEVLKAYAAGAANSAQSVAKQAQGYQKPEAAPTASSNDNNSYGLAA